MNCIETNSLKIVPFLAIKRGPDAASVLDVLRELHVAFTLSYFLNPALAYFGNMPAASSTLGDCDKYLDWRTSGGYVARFTVRGKPQTMQTRGGKRAVDLEFVVLGNAPSLAVCRGVLSSNPLAGRGRYTCASELRHCREVALAPEGLTKIETWLRGRNEHGAADVVCFLASAPGQGSSNTRSYTSPAVTTCFPLPRRGTHNAEMAESKGV